PSASERSENLAFALGQEVTAALGRVRRFEVIAGTSLNSAVAASVISEHQYRGVSLDYLVDVTVSDIDQDTRINVRLLEVKGNTRAVWSKVLDVTSYGVRRMGELVAQHILTSLDPGVPLGAGELKLPEEFGKAGDLALRAMKLDPDNAEAL